MSTFILQGDCFQGQVKLRVRDQIDPSQLNPFSIPVNAEITMNIPGTSGVVDLKTGVVDAGTGADEIIITDADQGLIDFKSTTESASFKIGENQTIEIFVLEANGCRTGFQLKNELTVEAVAVS